MREGGSEDQEVGRRWRRRDACYHSVAAPAVLRRGAPEMTQSSTQPTMRLFAALEIPSAWKSHFSDLQADLERAAPGALRWVRPELLHLTLAFLDEQPASALEAIQQALDRAAQASPAFRLDLGQPGLFARDGRVAVVWVGVHDESQSLAPLHARVVEALGQAGLGLD